MIKATVEEARSAFRALKRIGEETRLPQKAAWRISRLMGKLKPIVIAFEETQRKLFLDAGGVSTAAGVEIRGPERREDESDDDWNDRVKEHRDTMNRLSDDVRALDKESVEVDYDPIPLGLFDDDDPKRAQRFSTNDFLDVGPFVKE